MKRMTKIQHCTSLIEQTLALGEYVDTATIALSVGCSVRTVQRAIKRLNALGLLDGTRRIAQRNPFKLGAYWHIRRQAEMLADQNGYTYDASLGNVVHVLLKQGYLWHVSGQWVQFKPPAAPPVAVASAAPELPARPRQNRPAMDDMLGGVA